MSMEKEIIRIHNIKKAYQKNIILDNISFSVSKGSICGLIGENGAGKTTLIKILAGLIKADSGNVALLGQTNDEKIRIARKKCSFIVETPYFVPEMTAYENLNLQRIQRGIREKERIQEVLSIVGLEGTGRKRTENFSLGMKQRLGIAIALLEDIDVLVLDEPTNGLDPQGMIDFRNLILKLNRELGITILVSSHILSELEQIATDFVFMSKGRKIKQLSSDELVLAGQRRYHLRVSDSRSAKEIILRMNGSLRIEMKDEELLHVIGETDVRTLAKQLCENSIYIYEFYESTMNLETYYVSLFGGETE